MRQVEWVASSLADLKTFPHSVQQDIGLALFRVQLGETPERVKPLKGLPGVCEIRSDHKAGAFRAVYAIKLGAKIYILHAFQKKSTIGISTPRSDMELIRSRLKIARELANEEAS